MFIFKSGYLWWLNIGYQILSGLYFCFSLTVAWQRSFQASKIEGLHHIIKPCVFCFARTGSFFHGNGTSDKEKCSLLFPSEILARLSVLRGYSSYIYIYIYGNYIWIYGLWSILTGILDYLREGFPWPVRPFKHTESNSFKHTVTTLKYTNWYFILPPGALRSGPPSTFRMSLLYIYIYIYIICLSIYLPTYLSIYLSLSISLYLSIDRSIDLSISLYLSIYLSLSH